MRVLSTVQLGDLPGHDFHGNQWTGEGSGTKEDPIRCQSAEQAAKLIAEGKFVSMPPEKISILLDHLASLAQDAKAKGEKAPSYDLCHISVPDSNLFCAESKGIPRIEMPQLGDGVGFKQALTKDGYKFDDTSVVASFLKPTQNELNGGKVTGMMKSIEAGKLPPGRIFVSSDNYVIDGHHRWAAVVGEDYDDAKGGSLKIEVTKIDAPISVLIPYANKFAETSGEGHATLSVRQSLEFYSPDQQRDESGRFGSGGSSDAANAPKIFYVERDGTINTKDLGKPGTFGAGEHVDLNPKFAKGWVTARLGLYGKGELGLRISDKNLSPQQIGFFKDYLATHPVTDLRIDRYGSNGEGSLPPHSRDFHDDNPDRLLEYMKTGGSAYRDPWPPELRSTTEAPKNYPKSAQYLKVLQPTELDLSRFERAELYAEDQPRDANGQWANGDGLPRFKDSVAEPVKFLAEGKAGYIKLAGMAPPASKDWAKVMSDPHFGGQVADHYSQLPMYDKNAEVAYNQLAKEVDAQYAYLTQTMGVKVDVMDHDPYTTVQQLRDDLEQNHHLGVLATEVTGSHPYLSDTQNDHFRAVHDAFGHASIGRGFDRNGEEAAFQSHAQMFSAEATRALASETRVQNNAMIYGKYPEGTFPPQKFALLPAEDSLVKPPRTALAAGGVPAPTADDDNLYDVTHVHHTSLGRRLPASTASVEPLEFFNEDQERDEHGRWTSGGGGGDSAFDSRMQEMHGVDNAAKILDAMVTGRTNEEDVVGLPTDMHLGYITDEARAAAKADIADQLGSKIADAVKNDPAVRAEYERYMNTQTPFGIFANNRDFLVGSWGEQHGMPSSVQDGTAKDEVTWARTQPELPSDEKLYGEYKADQYVNAWAGSAADTSPVSLALQEVTAKELGAESESFRSYLATPVLGEEIMGTPASRSNYEITLATDHATMSVFVQSEYTQTQAWLKDQGIKPDDPVTLYRGMSFPKEIGKVGGSVSVDLNPASSWSVSRQVASDFANNPSPGVSYILKDTVRARDIISTALTGRGALIEGEVLVRNTANNNISIVD